MSSRRPYFDDKMLVFTAPSGAGKTTIVRHLLSKYEQLAFSVSATTRPSRDGEVHGEDYYFMTPDQFRSKIKEGAFVEFEEVYEDQFYGTLKSEMVRLWEMGKTVVFDIDVKGALNLQTTYTKHCKVVFVKPPSVEVLIQRLMDRKTEDEKSLKKRINRVKTELSYETNFDTVLVNDLLEVALKEAEIVVENYLKIS